MIACTRLSIESSERRFLKAPNGSGTGKAAIRRIKAMLASAPGP